MTPGDQDNEIVKLSMAMDQIAKLIAQKKQEPQVSLEYEKKVNELDKLINLLLNLSKTPADEYKLDTSKLDQLLSDGFEVVTKKDQKYILLPVTEASDKDTSNGQIGVEANKSKKKKKNKILCSFCNESGHTRAKCQKRLLTPMK